MIHMKREIERFGKICTKTQVELKEYLAALLSSKGYTVISEDGFLYAKGDLPYLVTAHMDTVHKVQVDRYNVHRWKGKHRIQAPKVGIGGDDRCGIYIIVRMVLDGFRPSILFCEDEEIGSVGARKFCMTKYVDDLKKLKYLIELDRANAHDAVFYDCDNPEFTEFILENTGYELAEGSWTDIVELSSECEIASVNFSCGYYKAHSISEYVIFEEMISTMYIVEKLLCMESKQFKFIQRKFKKNSWWLGNDDWGDDWGYSSYSGSYGDNPSVIYDIGGIYGLEIHYNLHGVHEEQIEYVDGDREDYCMYEFFKTHTDVCYGDIIEAYVI